ncbi:glycosyltransferases [Candidatus Scalindua japonica]|uniref:Glycosyltransferases n=1 Tax=Candidatus Scalindua japonica TaxID=1284222 RepID=A0A286TX39_9BACT|nr:glycosyltransferase family 2 protein [Candidatus Scalindua japonica]GAX60445.1 glycosyltransferases [Candidatus Scalindua japonica]
MAEYLNKTDRKVNPNLSDQAMNNVEVSIVIPAYNEEDVIADQIKDVHKVMEQTEWIYEVIVVNDGSTDGTAKQVMEQNAKLCNLPHNLGYGAALKTGIKEARSEYIVIIDADGTYPTTAIPVLLEKAHEYDMVVGARTGKDVNIPFVRKPAKWFLNFLANYLSGKHIPDLNSGLRVFRKSLIENFINILPSGFSFTTTITLAMSCNDYQVYYHSIDYYQRVGKSKIMPIHAYYFLLLIIRTIVYFNPLKVFLPLGGIFFITGIVKFIYDVIQWHLSESLLLGMLCMLSAGTIWSIGLLADLISKVGLSPRQK